MNVESMVASKTKNPVVVFRWGTERGELSPIEARGYAMQVLEASEAAVQDAALYRAMTVDTKASPKEAAKMAYMLINLVRKHRAAVEGVGE
jgi:hypothetical protein